MCWMVTIVSDALRLAFRIFDCGFRIVLKGVNLKSAIANLKFWYTVSRIFGKL